MSGALEWLSKDPIGISGGLNQYVFCGNNPVNFVDPFGLEPKEKKKPNKIWEFIKDFLPSLVDNAAPGSPLTTGEAITRMRNLADKKDGTGPYQTRIKLRIDQTVDLGLYKNRREALKAVKNYDGTPVTGRCLGWTEEDLNE